MMLNQRWMCKKCKIYIKKTREICITREKLAVYDKKKLEPKRYSIDFTSQ